MAFLLSAMMLITGTAMGAAPAAAAEKSPPALKSGSPATVTLVIFDIHSASVLVSKLSGCQK